MLNLWDQRRSRTCVIISPSDDMTRYMYVRRESAMPRVLAVGEFHRDLQQPWSGQLKAALAAQKIRGRDAMVLLPRSDLEISTLRVPPATEKELPQLVHNLLGESTGDPSNPQIVDYVVARSADEHGCEVLTVGCPEQQLQTVRQSLSECGLTLRHATYATFGAVELLRLFRTAAPTTEIIVGVGERDIDVAVVQSDSPVMFRTIPRSTDVDSRVAQRLAGELHRTLTFSIDGDDEEAHVFVLGSVEEQEILAAALADELAAPVSIVDPRKHITLSDAVSHEGILRFVDLMGAAHAWNRGTQELDLVHPKRPPKPMPVWVRPAVIAAAAMLLIATGTWYVRDIQNQQQDQITQESKKLKTRSERASRALIRKDDADLISSWYHDEVVWLDELNNLARRLPPSTEVAIQKLVLSASNNNRGVIDLSVNVSEADVMARMEDSIRDPRHSVSSKRVTDTEDRGSFPWQFQTRIVIDNAVEMQPIEPRVEDQEPVDERGSTGDTTAAAEGEAVEILPTEPAL
ncbi:MAG: hypothetical protein R3E01_30815 [Pirellulaceae bacterium]|nr:hypothetical protein [Planctomycetales bacterium]